MSKQTQMEELRKNIEKMAAKENKTVIEMCSMLQMGAANAGDDESIEILGEIKMQIFKENGTHVRFTAIEKDADREMLGGDLDYLAHAGYIGDWGDK